MGLSPGRLVRILVLLGCLFGFAAVMSGQLRSYLEEDTSTAITFQTDGDPPKFDMPVIVFCPKVISENESQLDVAGLDFSEFNRTMIRLGVVLHQAGIDAYDTDEKLPELDRVHLPTVYNGICEAFNLKTTVETNFKLRFRVSSDTPATVFLLSSPKETVFLLTGLTLPETQTVSFDSDVVVTLEKKRDIYLPKINGKVNCIEGNSKDGIFGKCVTALVEKEAAKHPCVPVQFALFVPSKPVCADGEQSKAVLVQLMKITSITPGEAAGCRRECIRSYPNVKKIPISIGNRSLSDFGGKYKEFIIYYSTGLVMEMRQYPIYTLGSIASSAGGAMGMFLGWSVFGAFGELWMSLKELLVSAGLVEKKKKRRKKNAK